MTFIHWWSESLQAWLVNCFYCRRLEAFDNEEDAVSAKENHLICVNGDPPGYGEIRSV